MSGPEHVFRKSEAKRRPAGFSFYRGLSKRNQAILSGREDSLGAERGENRLSRGGCKDSSEAGTKEIRQSWLREKAAATPADLATSAVAADPATAADPAGL